jgi:hypothetical protein
LPLKTGQVGESAQASVHSVIPKLKEDGEFARDAEKMSAVIRSEVFGAWRDRT